MREGGEAIQIVRDAFGVPEITASSPTGIWFGQGYVTAEDRLWQMDRFRRDARGELAEIGIWRVLPGFGQEAVIEHDRRSRRNSFDEQDRRLAFARLSLATRLALTAYRDGVNAYIKSASEGGTLPAIYRTLGQSLRLWSETDSMAIMDMLGDRADNSASRTLIALRLRDALFARYGEIAGIRMLNEIAIPDDPNASFTAPASEKSGAAYFPPLEKLGSNGLAGGWSDASLIRQFLADRERDLSEAREHGLVPPLELRSWAVSASRNEAGYAILFGEAVGPESAGTPLHEVVLDGPGKPNGRGERITAAGAAMPGIPGLMMGFNRKGAWLIGPTDLGTADACFEVLAPDLPTRYAWTGAWFDMVRRTEPIRVWRDGAAPELIDSEIFRTFHGPVVGVVPEQRQALVLRRPWWKLDRSACLADAMMDLCGLAGADDFTDALVGLQPCFDAYYAGVRGGIAYHLAGAHPTFPETHDRRLPSIGVTGAEEWGGALPFEHLPQSLNPPRGFLVGWETAKSKGWPDWRGQITQGSRMIELLSWKESVDPKSALEMVRATESDAPALRRLQPFLGDFEDRPELRGKPRVEEVIRKLKSPSTKDDRFGAPAFDEMFFSLLLREAFEDEVPAAFQPGDPEFIRQTFGGLLFRILDPRAERKPMTDYFNGASFQDLLVRTVVRMAESGGTEPGRKTEIDSGPRTRRKPVYRILVELHDPPRAQSGFAAPPGEGDKTSRDAASPMAAESILLKPLGFAGAAAAAPARKNVD